MYARLIMSISGCSSPYENGISSPAITGICSRRSSGHTQSNVRFVNGVCVPQRDGTLRL